MDSHSAEYLLQVRELQLNSLFELIKSINENASEDDLYKIYKFIIHSIHKIDRLALFVKEDDWIYKVGYGNKAQLADLGLPPQVLAFRETHQITSQDELGHCAEFDTLIPIKHKGQVLAYVLIGQPERIDAHDLDFVATLSNIIIVAIENKKLVRKQVLQEIMDQQLSIAKDVQTLLFPKRLPYDDRLRVVASYLPHHSVGGDYYDFLEINRDRFLLCVADVSGKGVPAAILMSNFQAALRILVRQHSSLQQIVEELNDLIMVNSQGENYITAFFAEYDFRYRTMTYINAGHNPPFMLTPDGQIRSLSEGTTILGGFAQLPFLQIQTINNLGSFLFFGFTDGFIETYNDAGEALGVDQLMEFVIQNQHLDQKILHERLIRHLIQFKGKQAYVDDITLLSCRVTNKGVR